MSQMKSLAKDTAIYGLSSIVGRFLNWCFVFLYINVLKTQAEYGVVTNLYAYMALLLIILTYGLETGFFRFANDDKYDPEKVYTTGLVSLACTSTLFFGIILLFLHPISRALGYAGYTDYIWMLSLIIAMDAFTALPFAYLRYQKRAMRFAAGKLLSIFTNIFFNLFFLLLCPWLYEHYPTTVSWFFNPSFMVGYILVSNIISSGIIFLFLLPEIFGRRYRFDTRIWKQMLQYSFPLLILGVAGIMNQTFDKMLYPTLAAHRPGYMSELGIYGAVYKIAIVLVMFTQAFRFAYEPFIFAKNKEKNTTDNRQSYADAMKYFIIFGLLIFLGVMFYIDLVRLVMPARYFVGITVVPIIMLAELFFGIFFNLSLWYKLTDRTQWGAWFSLFGFAVTITINVLFVPRYGYMACAWAAFFCYLSMMLASYFVGQYHYPIHYDLKSIARYTLLAGLLYGINLIVPVDNLLLKLLFRTFLLSTFIIYLIRRDLPLREIPVINRFIKKQNSGQCR